MVIKESLIVSESVQADNRRYIREQHTFEDGRVIVVDYLADADVDAEQKMNARVESLNEQVASEVLEAEAQILKEAAAGKLQAYIDGLSDITLTNTVGLSAEEQEVVASKEVKVG